MPSAMPCVLLLAYAIAAAGKPVPPAQASAKPDASACVDIYDTGLMPKPW